MSITHNMYSHKTDFLTLRLTETVPDWPRKVGDRIFPAEFVGFPLAVRKQIIRELNKRDYDSLIVTPLFEGGSHIPRGHPRFNMMERPLRFLQKLKPAIVGHKKIICLLHLEDSPNAQKMYGTLDNFGRVCAKFARVVGPSIDLWVWGVEATEWIAQMTGHRRDRAWRSSQEAFDILEKLGQRVKAVSDVDQVIHLNSGIWGPTGGKKEFWRDTLFSGLAYQYGNPRSGTSDRELRRHAEAAVERTKELVARIHPLGKDFIASEFSLHESEKWSRTLGTRLMKAGADASWNGAK